MGYIYAAIVAIILGLGTTAYIFYLEAKNATIQLDQAVEVNKANARAAKELREDWEADREATRKELAEAQKRASAIDQIRKDLENAPEAQDLAGPYFDELSKRLQSLDSGPAN